MWLAAVDKRAGLLRRKGELRCHPSVTWFGMRYHQLLSQNLLAGGIGKTEVIGSCFYLQQLTMKVVMYPFKPAEGGLAHQRQCIIALQWATNVHSLDPGVGLDFIQEQRMQGAINSKYKANSPERVGSGGLHSAIAPSTENRSFNLTQKPTLHLFIDSPGGTYRKERSESRSIEIGTLVCARGVTLHDIPTSA